MTRVVAFTLLCMLSEAAALDIPNPPPIWMHTATTSQVYVIEIALCRFPRFSSSAKTLVIACPRATWQAANPTKRNAIVTALRRWLNGDDTVSASTVQTLKTTLNDAGIGVGLTLDPHGQLSAWGLAPPVAEAP